MFREETPVLPKGINRGKDNDETETGIDDASVKLRVGIINKVSDDWTHFHGPIL